MRALVLLLAIVLHASPARADPPHFDIYPPFGLPSGRPFVIDIVRDGTWNERRMELVAEDKDIGNHSKSYVYVDLDGQRLANLLLVLEEPDIDHLPGYPTTTWIHHRAWKVTVPALDPGNHTITATYEFDWADFYNYVEPAVWTFAIGPSISLFPPPLPPKPLAPPPGLDPPPPGGFVTLFDIASSDVLFRPIADLLVVDPDTFDLSLDLAWLKGDTVVTYPGDDNYAPFNFTHLAAPPLAEPVPAPGAPFALAVAALAALRILRRAMLVSHPCPTPISSTSESTPATR